MASDQQYVVDESILAELFNGDSSSESDFDFDLEESLPPTSEEDDTDTFAAPPAESPNEIQQEINSLFNDLNTDSLRRQKLQFLHKKGAFFLLQLLRDRTQMLESFQAPFPMLEETINLSGISAMAPGQVRFMIYQPSNRNLGGPNEIVSGSPCFLLLFGVSSAEESSTRSGLNLAGSKDFLFRDPFSGEVVRIRVRRGRNLPKGIRAMAFEQKRYASLAKYLLRDINDDSTQIELRNRLLEMVTFSLQKEEHAEVDTYKRAREDQEDEVCGGATPLSKKTRGGSSRSKKGSNGDTDVNNLIKKCFELFKKRLTQPDLFDEVNSEDLFGSLADLCIESDGNFRLPPVQELACCRVDDNDDDSDDDSDHDEESGVEDAISSEFGNMNLRAASEN